MSGDAEMSSEEDFIERDKEATRTLDKLILAGKEFMETDEYKNSRLSEEYKSRIVKVFPIFLDTVMKGDMEAFWKTVQDMDAGDAYVLGMLTGRLFFNIAKQCI